MQRRRLLKLSGSLFLASSLTGCQEQQNATTPADDTIRREQDSPTSSTADTEQTPRTGNTVELFDQRLTESDQGDLYIKGKLRNTSSREIDLVRVNGEFYDANGTILEQGVTPVWHISSNDAHVFRILYPRVDSTSVEDYSLSLDVQPSFVTSDNNGQIQLTSQQQASFANSNWGVSGVIENVSDQSFSEVEIYAFFYADDNLAEFVGTGAVSNFDPNDMYEFQVYYGGDIGRNEVTQYELKITYLS